MPLVRKYITLPKHQPHIVTIKTIQTHMLLRVLLSIMMLPFINIYEFASPNGFSEHCLFHTPHKNLILQDDLSE